MLINKNYPQIAKHFTYYTPYQLPYGTWSRRKADSFWNTLYKHFQL
jgi:hypothetical protein